MDDGTKGDESVGLSENGDACDGSKVKLPGLLNGEVLPPGKDMFKLRLAAMEPGMEAGDRISKPDSLHPARPAANETNEIKIVSFA